ncbi:MAG TPA: hypothetical protein VF504_00390, partial [Solirubrobacterales bacterium]
MTPDQIIKPLRIMDDMQRARLLANAVNTPPIQKAMREAREGIGLQLAERFRSQIDYRKMLSPALLAQMQEQNAAIRQMLDTPGIRKAMANIDLKLPEGFADQIAAYGDQLVAEISDPDVAEERAGRLAEEREAIIKFLRRVGVVVEGFSYLPESPIPPLMGFLIILLAALSEVADEI